MGKNLAKKESLIIVIILGILLRFVNIDQSLWLDEAAQALLSSRSVHEIINNSGGDFHPPLFYIISHFWIYIGKSEFFLRILPISFGVVNLIAFYVLVKNLYPGKKINFRNFQIGVETVSVFFLAISPFHIYYSQEFRSYSLVCLFATISIYGLVKKNIHILVISNLLLIYTHYSTIFLILAELLYVIGYEKNFIKKYLLHLILVFIGYLPWMPKLFNQMSGALMINSSIPGWSEILSISPLKAMPQVLFKLIAGRINIYPKSIYYLYISFVLLSTVFAMFYSRVKSKLIFSWVFWPIILIILTSFLAPQTQPFRLIYILPGLLLLFIEAMFKSPKTFIVILLYISIFGNLLYFTRPRLQRENWIEATDLLSSTNQQILVKFPEPFAPLRWYKPELKYIPVVRNIPSSSERASDELSKYDLDQQVVVVHYLEGLTDPINSIESELIKRGYVLDKEKNIEGVGIISFYKK